MEIKQNDYVDVEYNGSTFFGKVTHVDTKHKEGTVTLSPGVSMILPLADMTVYPPNEREGD